MPADSAAPRRPYHQTLRAESTVQTRTRIRESARELLLDRGYAGTSMRAVAEHADVGVRTVYDYFSTKTDLLKDVVQNAIVGDSLPMPARERGWFQAVLNESDPVLRAALLARASTQLHQRTAALFAVVRSAAAADPDAAALWRAGKTGHRSDCAEFARATLGKRKNPSAIRALAATLYVLIGPETYTLLTDELTFTPRTYERWLRDRLTAAFERAGT